MAVTLCQGAEGTRMQIFGRFSHRCHACATWMRPRPGGGGGDKGGAALRARGEHFLSLTLRRRGRRFDARA